MTSSSATNSVISATAIHEFPNPTWIENLFVRSNGDVLLAVLSKPELYLLRVSGGPSTGPILLHSFAPSLGVLGIAEVSRDVFFVISGDYSVTTGTNTAGSYHIWRVDLTSFDLHSKVEVNLVTAMPEASLLNGMTKLPLSPHVLIADSTLGVAWSLNIETAKYEIAIDVPEMKIPPPPGFPLAINGVKVRDGYLYWTNSGKMIICRVRISADGKKEGEVEIIANTFGDDIAVDERGVWVAQGMFNTVGLVRQDSGGHWETSVVAGAADQILLAGGTACAFGRSESNQKLLFVVSNGGLAGPVNGKTIGGSVITVDTDGY